MTAKNLSTVTNELIASYGTTTRNVIQACRVGNVRIARYIDQRWASAVEKAGDQLKPEIRSNALAAERKVSAIYTRSVHLGTNGADLAVNRVLSMASKSVAQVAANASRFEKATGFTALNAIAAAAVPAAVAVSGVAFKVEAKSDQWVRTLAGTKPRAKRTVAKRALTTKPRAAAKVAKTVTAAAAAD
jgi:hypothetical protein